MDLQYQTVSTQYELSNSFGCPVSGIFKLLTELKDFLKEINDLGLLLKSSVLRFMGFKIFVARHTSGFNFLLDRI